MSLADLDGIMAPRRNRPRVEGRRAHSHAAVAFDFTEDPAGVMVVGKRCLDAVPGNVKVTGLYHPETETVVGGEAYFRIMWDDTISRKAHDEDAIAAVFIPQGETPKGRWGFLGIKPAFREAEGTVFEGLVKTLEDGVNCTMHAPSPGAREVDHVKW